MLHQHLLMLSAMALNISSVLLLPVIYTRWMLMEQKEAMYKPCVSWQCRLGKLDQESSLEVSSS